MPFSRRTFIRATAAASVAMVAPAIHAKPNADNWADFSGRVVFDGTAPTPKPIVVDKDQECCGKHNLINESLLVNPKNQGIKNVIVSMVVGLTESPVVHESYQDTETQEVVLENKNCRFEPHVVLMRTSQKLRMKACDPIASNVKIDPRKNPAINLTIASGTSYVQAFPKTERMPLHISCPIHTWESGYLVVKDHPYMAVTDEDGRFEIKNVPAGKVKFMFWHESAGYLSEVTIDGQLQEWRRGCAEPDLKPGKNDIGEIVVKAGLFEF